MIATPFLFGFSLRGTISVPSRRQYVGVAVGLPYATLLDGVGPDRLKVKLRSKSTAISAMCDQHSPLERISIESSRFPTSLTFNQRSVDGLNRDPTFPPVAPGNTPRNADRKN